MDRAFSMLPDDLGKTISFSLRPRPRPAAAPYLRVVGGGAGERLVAVTGEGLVLGRDPGLPFHLPDPQVSRAHCEVRLVGEEVHVRDLGSTNGTFVDGVAVAQECVLPLSSRLEIGRHALRLERLTPEDVAQQAERERELGRARSYVEALLPPPLPGGPLRTEWCFEPSSVLGGDALGHHELAGARLAFYVLDVCGHGVGSAMHSASVLNVLRGQALPDTDFAQPAQVLARLNAVFPMEQHDGMYFSLWYGVLEPASRKLCYASAGHPPAILLDAAGRVRAQPGTKNPPIGMLEKGDFAQAEERFELGERLYVFSDGVYELMDHEQRQRGRGDFVSEIASSTDRSPGEARRLYEAACAHSGTDCLDDDFTVLLVEHVARASGASS